MSAARRSWGLWLGLICAGCWLGLGLVLAGCEERGGEDWIGVWDQGIPDADDDTGDDDTGDDDSGDDDSGDDDTTFEDADKDGYTEDLDCDDQDPDTYPGAPELCDGKDNDCDEAVPADETDDDGDQYVECDPWVGPPNTYGGDCDDTNPNLSGQDLDGDGWTSCTDPADCSDIQAALNYDDVDKDGWTTCGADEVANSGDEDCDDTDPGLNLDDLDGDGDTTCGTDCDDTDPALNGNDADSDNYTTCDKPADCDDDNPTVRPFALEICGYGDDNDCDGAVDEGCDCPRYVDAAAKGSAEAGTWTDPYLTIGDGLADIAGVCDELHVLPGTYTENLAATGRSVTIRGIDGAAQTILDADLTGPALAWTVGSLTLSGVTVRRGTGLDGGGVSLIQSSAEIHDCVFENNWCTLGGQGAAIHATQAPSLTVRDTEITGNHCGAGASDAGNNGGGLFADASLVLIERVSIVGNTAGDGGGLALVNCDGEVRQAVIAANQATDTEPGLGTHRGGGGLMLEGGTVAVTSVLVVDNTSTDRGGGVITVGTGGHKPLTALTNVVVAHNTSAVGGGGIQFDPSGSIELRNSIVAFNSGAAGLDADGSFDAPEQWYCDVYGNTTVDYGTHVPDLTGSQGNLALDPLFIGYVADSNPFNDDYHLQTLKQYPADSPCLDAGDPDVAYDDVDGTRNDMGVYGGPLGDW